MDISDPHAPMSPYGSVGSVINVVASGVFGAIALIVAIVNSMPMGFVVALVFWGMCLFAFVPAMKRAKKYEQDKLEQAEAAKLAESSKG